MYMLVQFENNWIQKIPRTAKLDQAYGLVQFWLSSEFFSSNYFQVGQHVVLLLHILNSDYMLEIFVPSHSGSYKVFEMLETYMLGKEFRFLPSC